jgi:hypothetical protein
MRRDNIEGMWEKGSYTCVRATFPISAFTKFDLTTSGMPSYRHSNGREPEQARTKRRFFALVTIVEDARNAEIAGQRDS